MKEAIQRAIKGGWKPKTSVFRNSKTQKHILETFTFCYPDEESIRQHKHFYEYFLDPLFWQALGKVEGWDTSNMKQWWQKCDIRDRITLLDRWENEMHSFIDHIAGAGDVDSFFKELLKA